MEQVEDHQQPDESRPLKRIKLDAPLDATEEMQEDIIDDGEWDDVYETSGQTPRDEAQNTVASVTDYQHVPSAQQAAGMDGEAEILQDGEDFVGSEQSTGAADEPAVRTGNESENHANGMNGVNGEGLDKAAPVELDAPTEGGTALQDGIAREVTNGTTNGDSTAPGAPPKHDAEFLAAAAAQQGDKEAEWQFTSSDAESSTDESSSDESDSDDEDSYKPLDPESLAKMLMQEEDDEEERGKSKGGDRQPRTANEVKETVMPKPEIVVTHNMKFTFLGKVWSFVDHEAVIKGATSADYQVLDEGSVLCNEDRDILGVVARNLGSVRQPFYSVAFDSAAELEKAGLSLGTRVYYVNDHSTFLFTEPIRANKGTDASNIHDEEIAEDEQEFSDDEVEAEYKRQKKALKREGKGTLSRSTFTEDHATRPAGNGGHSGQGAANPQQSNRGSGDGGRGGRGRGDAGRGGRGRGYDQRGGGRSGGSWHGSGSFTGNSDVPRKNDNVVLIYDEHEPGDDREPVAEEHTPDKPPEILPAISDGDYKVLKRPHDLMEQLSRAPASREPTGGRGGRERRGGPDRQALNRGDPSRGHGDRDRGFNRDRGGGDGGGRGRGDGGGGRGGKFDNRRGGYGGNPNRGNRGGRGGIGFKGNPTSFPDRHNYQQPYNSSSSPGYQHQQSSLPSQQHAPYQQYQPQQQAQQPNYYQFNGQQYQYPPASAGPPIPHGVPPIPQGLADALAKSPPPLSPPVLHGGNFHQPQYPPSSSPQMPGGGAFVNPAFYNRQQQNGYGAWPPQQQGQQQYQQGQQQQNGYGAWPPQQQGQQYYQQGQQQYYQGQQQYQQYAQGGAAQTPQQQQVDFGAIMKQLGGGQGQPPPPPPPQ
ncbi:uncharacterized protein LTR77_006049 [Saxophila tyrrhenica]|uniref:H/ACA ribonucleoprotein complex non-core subunit NAF1 n=1 Tax=Saxophila tyrrhenica TaxID=1690608 RepID=A0AAV9PAZ1_9PEZI|nr:hypothetical protein LTR77_006049 [Saxophila tyrrhenica]